MTLADYIATLERRAAEADAVSATAPLADVYKALAAELRDVKDTNTAGPDRYLTADEVAARLNVSKRVVYQHADRWPFTQRVGRVVRFSERGFLRWLNNSTKAAA